MTALPAAFTPVTKRLFGLHGEQPAARPHGHNAVSGIGTLRPFNGTIEPTPMFQTALSHALPRRRTTRTWREFGLNAVLTALCQPGSMGIRGRDGHSRPLPSSETVAIRNAARAESRSDHAVRVPAQHRELPLRVHLPDPRNPVVAARNHVLAATVELGRDHRGAVVQGGDGFFGLRAHIPHLDAAALVGAKDTTAVTAEVHVEVDLPAGDAAA